MKSTILIAILMMLGIGTASAHERRDDPYEYQSYEQYYDGYDCREERIVIQGRNVLLSVGTGRYECITRVNWERGHRKYHREQYYRDRHDRGRDRHRRWRRDD